METGRVQAITKRPAVQLDRKFEAPCLLSMETMKKALLLSLAMMMSTAAFAAAPRPMPPMSKHKMTHQDKANHKWKKDKKWKKDHKKDKKWKKNHKKHKM